MSGLAPLTDAQAEQLLARMRSEGVQSLALEIADEAARAEIEMCCERLYIDGDSCLQGDWWNTAQPVEGDDPYFAMTLQRSVHYLGVRELLFTHPSNPCIVRFKELT